MKEDKQLSQMTNSEIKEKELKPTSGFTILVINLMMGIFGMYFMGLGDKWASPFGLLVVLMAAGMATGYFSVAPGESKLIMLLGQYRGTIKQNGFYWLSPFAKKLTLSTKRQTLITNADQVRDGKGQIFRVQASLTWQIQDTTLGFALDSPAATAEAVALDVIKESAIKVSLGTGGHLADFEATLRDGLALGLSQKGLSLLGFKMLSLAWDSAAVDPTQEVELLMAKRANILSKAISLADQAVSRMEDKGMVKLNEATRAKLISELVVTLAKDPS